MAQQPPSTTAVVFTVDKAAAKEAEEERKLAEQVEAYERAEAEKSATAAAQAVPPLEDAVRGNPSLWPAHANLATIYSGFGDRLRALGALQRAIDILVIRADGAPAVRVKG